MNDPPNSFDDLLKSPEMQEKLRRLDDLAKQSLSKKKSPLDDYKNYELPEIEIEKESSPWHTHLFWKIFFGILIGVVAMILGTYILLRLGWI